MGGGSRSFLFRSGPAAIAISDRGESPFPHPAPAAPLGRLRVPLGHRAVPDGGQCRGLADGQNHRGWRGGQRAREPSGGNRHAGAGEALRREVRPWRRRIIRAGAGPEHPDRRRLRYGASRTTPVGPPLRREALSQRNLQGHVRPVAAGKRRPRLGLRPGQRGLQHLPGHPLSVRRPSAPRCRRGAIGAARARQLTKFEAFRLRRIRAFPEPPNLRTAERFLVFPMSGLFRSPGSPGNRWVWQPGHRANGQLSNEAIRQSGPDCRIA